MTVISLCKMTVILNKKVYEKLKKHFKKMYPVENCAILLGLKIKDRYYIKEAYIPPVQEDCSAVHVQIKNEYYQDAKEMAKPLKLKVLGDIHSHCFDELVEDGSPSEGDWRGVWYMKEVCNVRNPIFGILKIDKTKKKRFRSKITFWNSTPPIDTHLF